MKIQVRAEGEKDVAKNDVYYIVLSIFITDQDSTRLNRMYTIFDIMPLPESHLLLTVVNALFTSFSHMSEELEKTVVLFYTSRAFAVIQT